MDDIELEISRVQKHVQGNPANGGVNSTLRTLGDIGLCRRTGAYAEYIEEAFHSKLWTNIGCT